MTPDAKAYAEIVDWLCMPTVEKTPQHVTNTQAMTNTYQLAWFRMASRMWLTRARARG